MASMVAISSAAVLVTRSAQPSQLRLASAAVPLAPRPQPIVDSSCTYVVSLCFCSLLSKTKVSIAAAEGSANSSVGTASLSARGAKLRNRYNSKHMTGFVLDLPDDVDEEDAIAKLNAHDEVVKVVPDTWVGIAGAAGATAQALEQQQ